MGRTRQKLRENSQGVTDSLSLSLSRDDMLFLSTLFFSSMWGFEQLVFIEGESKGATLIPYRSFKAYREMGQSSLKNPVCSVRNQPVCIVITATFIKCFTKLA
jgi:hypothetical protein